MANERLYQFPSKASPVPADIVYVGDSAASFNEVQCTIAEIIAAYPNLSGIAGLTLSANTYVYANSSAVLTAGSITALGISLLADSSISAAQLTLGYTATPGASKFAGWDANSNLSANSFLPGYVTTVTAGATTTLTVASAYQQYFTGSSNQTVALPVTSTLVLGQPFYIVNNSSGTVTVQSSGGNTIQAMAANTSLLVTCILTSGTTAASWNAVYMNNAALSLPLAVTSGGTGLSSTTINQILYSSANNTIAGLATANSSALITSSGGVPSLSQTLPSAVQQNITQLGAQAAALNMNSHLINNVTDPVSAQDAATKNYVDLIATGGAQPVYAASTANLAGYTYNNGVSGVGATLTAGSNAAFALDGTSPPLGARILYKDDSTGSGAYNGIYTLTQVGSGILPAILTRAIDYDTVNDINDTGLIPVTNGTANANTAWYNTTTMVTVGTTALTFTKFGSSTTVASKAQQEAASSNTVFVTPAVQQYHPSATQAWYNYSQQTPALNASYNVSSVTNSSAGVFIVNFSVAFNSGSYGINLATAQRSGTFMLINQDSSSGPNAGSCQINTALASTLVLTSWISFGSFNGAQ